LEGLLKAPVYFAPEDKLLAWKVLYLTARSCGVIYLPHALRSDILEEHALEFLSFMISLLSFLMIFRTSSRSL